MDENHFDKLLMFSARANRIYQEEEKGQGELLKTRYNEYQQVVEESFDGKSSACEPDFRASMSSISMIFVLNGGTNCV